MSTDIGVKCQFVLSSCVLCIVLTPQIIEMLLKKEYGKKLDIVYLLFLLLIKSHMWKHII